jgi:hypothetical protein
VVLTTRPVAADTLTISSALRARQLEYICKWNARRAANGWTVDKMLSVKKVFT